MEISNTGILFGGWDVADQFSISLRKAESYCKQPDNEQLPRLPKLLILPVNKATPSFSCLHMHHTDVILLDWCYTKIWCRMSLLANRHFLLKSFVEDKWIFLLFTVPFLTSSDFLLPELSSTLLFLAFHHLFLFLLPSLSFSAFSSGHFCPFSIPSSRKKVSHYFRTAEFLMYPLI